MGISKVPMVGHVILTSALLRKNEKCLLQPYLALAALHFQWLKHHTSSQLTGGARARQVIMIYSAGADRSP